MPRRTAPTKPSLRAVAPDEKPPTRPRKPMTLEEAVESGDHFEIKLAQQRAIVQALRTATGPAEASLHRQLSLVSEEVENIRAARRLSEAEEDDQRDAEVEDADFDASAV